VRSAAADPVTRTPLTSANKILEDFLAGLSIRRGGRSTHQWKDTRAQEEPEMTATIATTATTKTRKFAVGRYATIVTRVLTGLLFATTGLNGFLMFMPAPDPSTMAPAGVAFSAALYATGYMLQLASGVQLVAGILLLAGRFVPLALAMLAPMVVNIFLFHVFLEPSGIVTAVVVAAAEIGLAWAYRDKFRPMLQAR
jgi:uncharacterized membrane protein YphA (DoxX/SURF4 family)